MTYDEFINNIIETRGQWSDEIRYSDRGCERHHIIPRCIGGNGRLSWKHHNNIIWLYPREHFIAHKLLAEENKDNYKLILAWSLMAFPKNPNLNRDYEITPEEYEELRNLIVIANKNPERCKKVSIGAKKSFENGRKPWNFGKTGCYSEEWYKNQSERQMGENNSMHNIVLTEEQHENYRNGAAKRVELYGINGGGNKRVKCIELNREFMSYSEASRELGIDRGIISECVRGLRELGGGYHWEALE